MSDVNWPDLNVQVPNATPAKTLLELAFEITGLDPTAEATLRTGLNMAGNMVEMYLDRVIAKRAVQDTYAHHFGVVVLKQWPLDALLPPVVDVDGTTDTTYDVFTQGPNNYLTRQPMARDTPLDWRAFAAVTIDYTAGYDPLPADLAQAVVYTAMTALEGYGEGSLPSATSGEVRKETVQGVGSIEYALTSSAASVPLADGWGVVPPVAAQILSKYKRIAA